MKCLFACSSDIDSFQSGYSRRCTATRKYLKDNDFDVDYFFLDRSVKPSIFKKIIFLMRCFYLPYHVVSHRFVVKFDKYDVIYITHILFLYWIPRIFISRVVVDIHADPVDTYIGYANKSSLIKKYFFNFEIFKTRIYENIYLKSAAFLVSCNDSEKIFYQKYNKVIFLGNGYNPSLRKCALPEYVSRTREVPVVGFLGGSGLRNVIASQKFIELVGRSNVKGIIAGHVCNSILDEYPPNIHLLGGMSEDGLANFYDSIDFLLLPFELGGGSKLKVLEAWGFGRLVFGFTPTFDGLSSQLSVSNFIVRSDCNVDELCERFRLNYWDLNDTLKESIIFSWPVIFNETKLIDVIKSHCCR